MDAFVVPFDFVQGRATKDTRLDGVVLHFQTRLKSQDFTFDGRLADTAITGSVTRGEQQMPFRLDRIATVAAGDFVGLFEMEDGRLMVLHTASILGTNGDQISDPL